jgi:hypothetical protein
MKTIVLDGVEYVLTPKDQSPPVVSNPSPNSPSSPLADFLGQDGESPRPQVDDGLATPQEKQEAIKIVVPGKVSGIPKAKPQESPYWKKFKSRTLTPYDVTAIPTRDPRFLSNNPEDPMIRADASRPKEKQLFYGPGIEFEY